MITQFCTQCGSKLTADTRFCSACGTEIKQSVSQASAQPEGKRRLPLKRGSAPTPIILVIASAIILLVVGLFLLANSSRPASTTGAAAAPPDSHDEEGIPYPEVARISLAETKARFDTGAALIVDVRSQEDYNTAHIPDAMPLPLADLEARYRELPQDAEIITYCTWPNEESSARAARILMDKGYTNVKALQGGFRAWQQAGYPSTGS